MKRKIFILVVTMLLSNLSFAGYVGNLKIDRLWVEAGGVFFGFTTTPPDCTGHYAAAHARLPKSNTNYQEIFSLLLAARMSGKTIDIWYSGEGGCTQHVTVLQVYAAGIHVGQN